MTISNQILLKLRQDRGWSQEKLAAISGVSERTIQRVERDGASCSLDTKLALASAFEISPTELFQAPEPKDSKELRIDWGGIVGLFVLGLASVLIVLLTGTSGRWEAASAFIVLGLSIILSIMNYGARETYYLFDKTSWIVQYPVYVSGLNKTIIQAQSFMQNAYIIGVVASLISALTLVVHTEVLQLDPAGYLAIVSRPLVYAILLVEFWFRPYKRKMERMLALQREQREI